MRVPRQNQLTYEEVSNATGLSVCEVNSYIESGYNKMVNYLVDSKKYDIFDAIKWLRETLNMSEKEAIDKLSKVNYIRLKESLEDQDLFS